MASVQGERNPVRSGTKEGRKVEAHACKAAVLRRAALPFALVLMILTEVGVVKAQSSREGQAEPAELVLRNGRIVTLDEARPEATALAASAGRIMAVGSDEEIDAYIGAGTEVIDLEGRLAIPGFIEGHGHFMGLGTSRLILDLMHVAGWDEIVDMVADAARDAAPGEWIRGRGWHQEKWESVYEPTVDEVPIHTDLSAVSPENPVLLGHASGHAAFANAFRTVSSW